MAKIKLLHFELISTIEESKRLFDYLQRLGITELKDVESDDLMKLQTSSVVTQFERKQDKVNNAVSILEEYCEFKKSLIQSLIDYSEIEYHEYLRLCDEADDVLKKCEEIIDFKNQIQFEKSEIIRQQTLIDYYKPWEKLDIPMASKRTRTTSIFIGSFRTQLSEEKIYEMLSENLPDIPEISLEVVNSSKTQTCVVVMCHHSDSTKVEQTLKTIGFIKPDNPASKLPSAAIKDCEAKIKECEKKIENLRLKVAEFSSLYNKIRLLSDYYSAQIIKYQTMNLAATSNKAFILEGYIPERNSEEFKFEIENKFTAEVLYSDPDYESDDVPVLIENKGFAAGVESISNMYSPPSNKDLDPNPVMSFFFYLLFGMMLSDAGYGLLMVIVALLGIFKFKIEGAKRKTLNFVLYCGISTMIWGVLFGGFFGDLIPTICTNYLGWENPPSMALWFEPTNDSIKLLLFSFLIGIIHLFTGLAMRFVTLFKQHDYIGAFCDTIPVYVFVAGFAIVGKDFIDPVSAQAKSIGMKLLLAGAILIILTAGRSAKNIFGKLGGGLYALYNSTTGYLSDILSYSRLLALGLVTGVIASVVNMLGAITGNIFTFILIFLAGHAINIAINLIGAYVHTCRLQYVEYFSKFYEGGGRCFTPFKLDLKHFKFKEETYND